jgi:Tfp pilus assembly protein PilN
MKFSLPSRNSVRLAVVLLGDRLAVAAIAGERVETFSIAAENPAEVLQQELASRQLAPRSVALGLARGVTVVKPIEMPAVAGDVREMLRLNLEGHVPFAAEDAAFDFVSLGPDGDAPPREEPLQRLLVVAAEPRVVDAALRFAQDAQLRPVSLTVAAHDLRALARPERGQRVIWVHRTGTTADVLCLAGPALQLSRSVPAADEAGLADEVRRTLGVVRWRGCDAVWVSGDVSPAAAESLTTLGAPVTEPPWTPRAQSRVAALAAEDRGASLLALAVVTARGGRPLDLLPVPLRPRRLTRPQGITLGVACATAALLLTALLVPTIREQRQLSRINAEITRVEPEVRAVERVLRDLERKRKLLATINGIETSAMRPLPVLRELTDLLPSDTWLTTLSLDQKGVELTGQAAAASALIPLLENSPLLEHVEFSSPVTRGRDKEQFRIRAAWEAGGQARATAAASPPAPAPGPPAPVTTPPGAPRRPPGPAGPTAPAPVHPAPPPGGGRS